MISIIICSIDDAKSARIQAHYHGLLAGYAHEIILIRDAKSLCEGYNRGFAQSSGETLIFSHDDIEILSDDFAARLLQHLTENDVVGVGGTSRLVGPSWFDAGQPHIHGGITHRLPASFRLECFGPPSSQVQAIDGVFMAARRKVVEAIPFDAATFDGFHLYDLDFSYRAHLAGFRIAVPWDIMILHDSMGKLDAAWQDYGARFVAKHRASLPDLKPGIRDCVRVNLSEIEEVKLRHRRMIANRTTALEADAASMAAISDPMDPAWQSTLLELPICLPQSAWLGHIPFLSLIFRLMRPGRYVELGVDLGASFLAACEASRREASGTQCLGIDTWQGDPHAGVRDGSRAFEGLAHVIAQNFAHARLMRATFNEALDQCADGSIDLLHIDGMHTYDAVKHDFETWLPKLSHRGVVLLHDTKVFRGDFGVWRFFLELQQRYWGFEFFDWHGLGVVVVGSEPDAGVGAFMDYVSRSSVNAKAMRGACEAAARTMPDRLRAQYELNGRRPMPGMEKLLMRW